MLPNEELQKLKQNSNEFTLLVFNTIVVMSKKFLDAAVVLMTFG